MRKSIKILALTLVLIYVFSACGSSGGSGGGATTGGGASTGGGAATGGGATSSGGAAAGGGSSSGAGAAAGGGSGAPVNADVKSTKDTLVMRMQSDPGHVDLALGNITESIQIMSLIANRLLDATYDENKVWSTAPRERYSLATGYDFDDDSMGMTWHLREGVKFHNGDDFDAEDVVYSIQRYSTNASWYWCDFPNIKVVDTYTFHVPFTEPFSRAYSSIGGIVIISKETLEKDPTNPLHFSKNYVGTGAWKIANWIDGDSITLKAFDGYFGGKAKIENIVIRFIPDAAVAMMELETGGVDLVDVPSWPSVKSVMDGNYEGQIKYTGTTDNYLLHLWFNCSENSPFKNFKVRQAAMYAMNREDIAYGAFEGIAILANTIPSIVADDLVDFSGDKWPYPQDIGKAKALLAEAGYPNGFDAKIINYGDQNDVLANQILKNQLSAIGINLTIEQFDTATWISIMTTQPSDWDLCFRLLGGPGSWLGMMWNTNRQWTHVTVESDPAFAELYTLAREGQKILDYDKRAEVHYEIQNRYFQEWLYSTPIIQKMLYILYADNLQGVLRYGYYWSMLDAYFD